MYQLEEPTPGGKHEPQGRPLRHEIRIRGSWFDRYAAAAAASAVAAVTVAASIVLSPVPDAASRMDGVHADLQRAVELNQITAEQAEKFEAKLAGRILGEA